MVGNDYLDLEGYLASSSHFEVYRKDVSLFLKPEDKKSRNLLTLVPIYIYVISNVYKPHFDDTIFDQKIVHYVPSGMV